jgi:hypothetical protein
VATHDYSLVGEEFDGGRATAPGARSFWEDGDAVFSGEHDGCGCLGLLAGHTFGIRFIGVESGRGEEGLRDSGIHFCSGISTAANSS